MPGGGLDGPDIPSNLGRGPPAGLSSKQSRSSLQRGSSDALAQGQPKLVVLPAHIQLI